MKTYRELHPIKEGKRKWRYVTVRLGRLPLYNLGRMHPNCILKIKGKTVAEIRDGFLYYCKDYAWNGCSPKVYIGWPPIGLWVGTPDFECTIIPSLGHDILFQFSALLRYTMNVVNDLFLEWLDDEGASAEICSVYHGAVAKFGHKFWGVVDPDLTVEYL